MKEKLKVLLDYLKEKLVCSFIIYYTDEDKKDIREDFDEIEKITDLSQCDSKKKETRKMKNKFFIESLKAFFFWK